ncbi:hypothetical protein GJAV_G00037470 [Gymnothorax javanicus]|nr:hypothetical protein GJAV_G00037470 [Gymnothorax javanicus]
MKAMVALSVMGRSCRALLKCASFLNTSVNITFLTGRSICCRSKVGMGIRGVVSQAGAVFTPTKVAVVIKTTRYEFEQQRYRFAELSEEDMKHLLAMKGSSYSGLRERHNIHTRNVERIVESLE